MTFKEWWNKTGSDLAYGSDCADKLELAEQAWNNGYDAGLEDGHENGIDIGYGIGFDDGSAHED
jgi:flagellar biosynthesis/type III secretory pathway protein FliH